MKAGLLSTGLLVLPVAAAAQGVVLGFGQPIPAGYAITGQFTNAFDVACPVKPTVGDCILRVRIEGAVPVATAPKPAPAVPMNAPVETAPPASPEEAAQKAEEKQVFETIATYAKKDLTVPSSPAFAILGISPDKVERPGTIREFVGSLTKGIGPDGKSVGALAIDISPGSVFFRRYIHSGPEYGTWRNYPMQLLARTTVSFATTDKDSNGANKTAWGVRVGILDFGDPGMQYTYLANCLRKKIPQPPTGMSLEPTKAEDAAKCNPEDDPNLALWAKPTLYGGYGRSWFSSTGSFTNKAPDAMAWWLTASAGYTKMEKDTGFRLLGQAYFGRRVDDRTPSPTSPTTLLRQDARDTALRLRLGKENWHGFAEYGRSNMKLDSIVTQHIRHTAFGAEIKLGFVADTWLKIGTVRERGFIDGKDRSSASFSMKFGEPFLTLPGGK